MENDDKKLIVHVDRESFELNDVEEEYLKILAPPFRAMIEGGWQESDTREVWLSDGTAEQFRLLLAFCGNQFTRAFPWPESADGPTLDASPCVENILPSLKKRSFWLRPLSNPSLGIARMANKTSAAFQVEMNRRRQEHHVLELGHTPRIPLQSQDLFALVDLFNFADFWGAETFCTRIMDRMVAVFRKMNTESGYVCSMEKLIALVDHIYATTPPRHHVCEYCHPRGFISMFAAANMDELDIVLTHEVTGVWPRLPFDYSNEHFLDQFTDNLEFLEDVHAHFMRYQSTVQPAPAWGNPFWPRYYGVAAARALGHENGM